MSRFDPIAALRLTLQDPRKGLRVALSLQLSTGERLAALAAMAILNVLAAEAFAAQIPDLPQDALSLILDRPVIFAGMQLFGLFLMSGLVQGVGRLFGGKGDLAGAQVAVLWLHVILLLLQLAQVVALALAPPLTMILSLATLGAALWFFPHFVAELHGFRSAGLTFLGILATIFALLVLTTFAMAPFLGSEV